MICNTFAGAENIALIWLAVLLAVLYANLEAMHALPGPGSPPHPHPAQDRPAAQRPVSSSERAGDADAAERHDSELAAAAAGCVAGSASTLRSRRPAAPAAAAAPCPPPQQPPPKRQRVPRRPQHTVQLNTQPAMRAKRRGASERGGVRGGEQASGRGDEREREEGSSERGK